MKKINSFYKVIDIIFGILVLVLISYIIYDNGLNDAPNNDHNNGEENIPSENTSGFKTFMKLEEYFLDENNQSVVVNGNEVKLKVIDNVLYFNDKEIPETYPDYVYITDYFILIGHAAQCGTVFDQALTSDGEFINFSSNNYQLWNIKLESGKIMARGINDCPCGMMDENEVCNPETSVELSYDGNSIIIK